MALSDCKGPIVGGTVKFAVGAGAAGSALSALSSQTDAKGEAVVTLTAGQAAATFDVTASADPAKPAVVHVTVAGPTVGALDVSMSYAGMQAFVGYQILLFEGQACANLDRYNLPKPALASSAAVTWGRGSPSSVRWRQTNSGGSASEARCRPWNCGSTSSSSPRRSSGRS